MRERLHFPIADVRRIADNGIKNFILYSFEEVAAYEVDPVANLILHRIHPGYFKALGRNIGGDDGCTRLEMRDGDADRPRSATQIQHAAAPGQSTPAGMSNEELQIMKEVRDLLSTLNSKGVKAPIVLSEFERKRELLDNSRNIGRK